MSKPACFHDIYELPACDNLKFVFNTQSVYNPNMGIKDHRVWQHCSARVLLLNQALALTQFSAVRPKSRQIRVVEVVSYLPSVLRAPNVVVALQVHDRRHAPARGHE